MHRTLQARDRMKEPLSRTMHHAAILPALALTTFGAEVRYCRASTPKLGFGRSAEQLFRDHHALDLVGAFVDLGGLQRSSGSCRLVLLSAAELQRCSDWWWAVLPCDAEY